MIETRFKETEVGRIPEDWEVKPLADIGNISKGAGISRAEALSGNIPAIRYGEIYTCHNDYIKSFHSFISQSVAESSVQIFNGDILFAASGETKEEIGKSVAYTENETAYAGGDIIILHSDTEKFDAKFCGYALNAKCVIKQKAQRGQGDAVVHIVPRDLATILFAFPTKSEQTRIATALSNIDTLISELGKLIEKKRAIKQGAMQQLLTGKKRLKGFSEPWVKSLIKDLYHVTRGYVLAMTKIDNHKSAKYPYPVFSSQTKDNGIAGYYSQYLYENAITWTTDGANAGNVKYRNGKFYCTNVCGVLLRDNGMANLCMAGILGLVSKSHVSYIGNPKLMNNTMAEIEIYHPSDVKEQIAISDILIKIDDEITSLEAKKAKYEQIKQGMMQQLLTGKIRLI